MVTVLPCHLASVLPKCPSDNAGVLRHLVTQRLRRCTQLLCFSLAVGSSTLCVSTGYEDWLCLLWGFCGDNGPQNHIEEVEEAAVPHSRGCDRDFCTHTHTSTYVHTHIHIFQGGLSSQWKYTGRAYSSLQGLW